MKEINRDKAAASKRRARRRRLRNRRIALTVCLMLAVMAVSVGGTIAWLTDQTVPVTNTFTAGDISITLTETTTDYKMVPGNTIAKDPKVTVKGGSEACWLFVKVVKANDFDAFMTYGMADGWTALADTDGVYCREVPAAAADTSFYVLANNQVTVKTDVTKAQLNALNENTQPKLTFTAYAVQKDNIADVAAAWAQVTP